MTLETQIRNSVLFSSVPAKGIRKIMELSASRTYRKGEFVTHEADIWPYLLLVHTGQFQVLKESTGGRSFVIEDFGVGDIFWGLALFEDDEPNPAAIRASMSGEILLWHKNQIEAIISDNTQVAWGLFNLLAKKMGRVGAIVEELAFQPLTGRLANLLIEQFDDVAGDVIARDLTLDDMAARIGTTREMVCKILYRFSDDEIIDIHRTEMKINHREKLVDIAGKMKG
jgi:CRP-like cAMP-binding protein